MTRTEWKEIITKKGFFLIDNTEAEQRAENLFYYAITALSLNDSYSELIHNTHVEYIFIYNTELSDYRGKHPDTIAISATFCRDNVIFGAIGLTPEAMKKNEDEILFYILHELCHIFYNSDAKNYDEYMQHSEFYEAALNQLIECFNDVTGRHIENHHAGYGIF